MHACCMRISPDNNHSLYSLQATAVYTVASAATAAAELGLLRTFRGDEATDACNNTYIHTRIRIRIYIYIYIYTYILVSIIRVAVWPPQGRAVYVRLAFS